MNNQPLWYPLDNFSEDIENNIRINREIKKNYDFHRKLCFFLIIFVVLLYIFLLEEDQNLMNSFKNLTL